MKYFSVIFLLSFTTCQVLYSQVHKTIDEAIDLINKNKYDEAIEILETNGKENDILIAIAYLGKKDFKTAKAFALQYWFNNENDVLANYVLALISEELKEYNLALMYWSAVLKNAKVPVLKQLAKKHIEVLNKLK
ncbi:MAG: hypothetical protein ABDH23_00775 [Endomicrobiia bacterium]